MLVGDNRVIPPMSVTAARFSLLFDVGHFPARDHLAVLADDASAREPGEAEEVSAIRRAVQDGHALYQADRYTSVARKLPGLLRLLIVHAVLLDYSSKVSHSSTRGPRVTVPFAT